MRTHSNVQATLTIGLSLVVILGPLAACSGDDTPDGQTTFGSGAEAIAEPLPPAVQSQLDSANVAYRAGEYAAALDHFSAVVRMDPQLAAGWYGVGLTQLALGNLATSDSAMAEVHRLAPAIPLDHPMTSAPPNPHAVQPDTGGGQR